MRRADALTQGAESFAYDFRSVSPDLIRLQNPGESEGLNFRQDNEKEAAKTSEQKINEYPAELERKKNRGKKFRTPSVASGIRTLRQSNPIQNMDNPIPSFSPPSIIPLPRRVLGERRPGREREREKRKKKKRRIEGVLRFNHHSLHMRYHYWLLIVSHRTNKSGIKKVPNGQQQPRAGDKMASGFP